MVNGLKDFLFRPFDFGRQGGNPFFQFSHRKRVEILLRQQADYVAFVATRQKVIRIHGLNVDP